MNTGNRSRFSYVIFIRATPEKLWAALTDPQAIRQYWFGMSADCAWKQGAPWKMSFPDGRVADTGEILEIDPPRRMVIRWQHEWKPEIKAEGPSRCTLELQAMGELEALGAPEPRGAAVKLTVTHEIDRPEAQFIAAVAEGWPRVLSNLKSLLETGAPVFKELHA